MSILIDENTRVVVQGLTGREGTFHSTRNRDFGTNIVAGVTPGKGGTKALDGTVPVFDTVQEAVNETGANAASVLVPARFDAAGSILEAEAAGCELVVCLTDGVPVADMMRVKAHLAGSATTLIGPNCPGIISPLHKVNIGFIPHEVCAPGDIGVVSRSGTLTYQIINELTVRGRGQSTCIGIGGDPVGGMTFLDALKHFEADPETKAVVLIGEIGGDAEERAAEFAATMSTPVVGYIAGFSAPPGKRMGHAGAIITGSSGTAEAKAEALEARGVKVGRTPTEVADMAVAL